MAVREVFFSDPEKRAQELIDGRCYFTGNCCRDYCYHVLNWHPLLSVYCSDEANLYTKSERLGVLIVVSVLSVVLCAGLLHTLSWEYAEANKLVPEKYMWVIPKQDAALFMGQKFMIFMCVTIPIMLVQYFIQSVIVKRELHQREFNQTAAVSNYLMARCMNFLKRCCLTCGLWISFCLVQYLGYCYYVDPENTKALVYPLVISRLQSWLLWFATDLYMPCLGGFITRWCAEKKHETQDVYYNLPNV